MKNPIGSIPLLGRLLGLSKKDKDKAKPKEVPYGGTKEREERYRRGNDADLYYANKRMLSGLAGADKAAAAARSRDNATLFEAGLLGGKQGGLADRSADTFRAREQESTGNRANMMDDAAAIRAEASGLEDKYRRTSEAEFARQQDSNLRAMQSAAAAGGSAGSLRDAMATASEANAGAAAQAEITRARELNAMAAAKMQGLSAAAGIEGNAGSQAQSSAFFSGNRELAARNNQADLLGFRNSVNNAGAVRDIGVNMGKANIGLSGKGTALSARNAMESAILGVGSDYERQRQSWNREQYNNKHFLSGMFNQM